MTKKVLQYRHESNSIPKPDITQLYMILFATGNYLPISNSDGNKEIVRLLPAFIANKMFNC